VEHIRDCSLHDFDKLDSESGSISYWIVCVVKAYAEKFWKKIQKMTIKRKKRVNISISFNAVIETLNLIKSFFLPEKKH
jgi:hypothetical protein